MTPALVGALIIAVPALVLAWAVLRRQIPVFLFAAALILVGTGYLVATGATADIATWLIPDLAGPPPARAQ